jgi:sulfur carrier protein
MRILVNGAWRETLAAELSAVLQELGYREAVVATAVNGEFVAAGVRACTRLA